MTIEQWVRQGENKLKVTFDYDNEFDILTLNELLLYELKLEKYADSKPPPKPKGQGAIRMAQDAIGRPDEAMRYMQAGPDVTVDYLEGSTQHTQTWKHVQPDTIRRDWFQGPKFEAKLNIDMEGVEDVYDLFEKAAFPNLLLDDMLTYFNLRLVGSKDDYRYKTTKGELIAVMGYFIAYALNPGAPMDEMHQDTPGDEDILPPPNMSRHGIVKNRIAVMRTLFGQYWHPDEIGLDPKDPWRYCRLPVEWTGSCPGDGPNRR